MQRRDGSHRGIALSKTERHQTALRGQAPACSHAGTASPTISLSGGMLDGAPQKPLRADEPVTQNDELGPRRVTTGNQTGAAGIETRAALLVWAGCPPRRLQLVFTRSSGRNSLFRRCGKRCCRTRGRIPSGSMVVLRSPAWGPIQAKRGPTNAAARRAGSKPQKKSLESAVVVSAPVRRAAPQAGPKFRHGLSCRVFLL